MPVYAIKRQDNRGGTLALAETSSKGKVTFASVSYQWAVGKELAMFSEWCNKKHLKLERITDKIAVAQALNSLHPTGKLEFAQ